MAQQQNTSILRVMHEVCCGLDVHKKLINACLITTDENGQEDSELRVFQTFTDDLYRLRDWLLDHNCPIVAMESTGIYWRPVHNILEGLFEIILVNARHFKNLPGKKTDMSDSHWICGLLRVGLLKGSFIPEKHVRQWRDLTRYRRSKIEDLGDAKRQVHKLFESAKYQNRLCGVSDIYSYRSQSDGTFTKKRAGTNSRRGETMSHTTSRSHA